MYSLLNSGLHSEAMTLFVSKVTATVRQTSGSTQMIIVTEQIRRGVSRRRLISDGLSGWTEL